MSTISFVPAAAAPNGAATAQAAATLSDNFDTFLTILTAQVQNQDPLEPLDSTQFTQQLVQFSGVEQQIRTNQGIDRLIAQSSASSGAALAGYLGQEVEIASDSAAFAGAPVEWRFNLPQAAAEAQVSVFDAAGRLVHAAKVRPAAGANAFVWSGETLAGGTAQPGAYRIAVAAADADGAALTARLSVVSKVTGVDLSHGEPAIGTPAGVYAWSDVRRVSAAR
jgi:flagellar basal-body rod modification protein FlgD